MNREIKFRAWDTYAKPNKMVMPNSGDLIGWHSPSNWQKCYKIMQYINSEDKNGKEVYEGDILKAPSGELFVVQWHEDEMRWAMNSKDTWYNMNMGLHEVVGNIFENPELCDGKN